MNKEIYKLIGELTAVSRAALYDKEDWEFHVIGRAVKELEKAADGKEPVENPAESAEDDNVKPGDHFMLGGVEWIALEKQGDAMLSVTAQPIEGEYVFSEKNSNKWSKSDVRKNLEEWHADLCERCDIHDAFKIIDHVQTDEASEEVDEVCSDFARLLTLEEFLRFRRLGYIGGYSENFWQWSMTATRGYAYYVWLVGSSGTVTYDGAHNGYRLCPACVIKLDAIEPIK